MSEIKVKVEIEASPDLKDLLSSILVLQTQILSRPEPIPAQVAEPKTEAVEHPADALPPATVEDVNPPAAVEDVNPPAPPVEVKSYTKDGIRKAVMMAARKGPTVKAQVKAILNKYAPSVDTLPESDYPAFMAELEAL